MLAINNISLKGKKSYRLKNINLIINKGENIALLGKSGAGKTSLIKIANGSLTASTGSVTYDGLDIRYLSKRKRIEIGTLWQDLRLIEELSVLQNVSIGDLGRHNCIWALANLFGLINNKDSIECIKAAKLSLNLIETNVKDLSGGQRQRVAIARLLLQKTNIILADEPLSNLDPKLSKQILSLLIKGMQTANNILSSKTSLISIHQPELISNFSRVIGMKYGQILVDKQSEQITPEDLDLIYN